MNPRYFEDVFGCFDWYIFYRMSYGYLTFFRRVFEMVMVTYTVNGEPTVFSNYLDYFHGRIGLHLISSPSLI